MLHNESFIIGLAVGKKMGGGGTLDTNALEVGGGDFVDIWTIPVYEQSAEVTAAAARTRRAWYVCDILNQMYGAQSAIFADSDGLYMRWILDEDNYSGDPSDGTYDVMQEQVDSTYTANWATVPARLLVSSSMIAVVLLDAAIDMPVVFSGFVRQYYGTTSVSARWKPITLSNGGLGGMLLPGGADQNITKIDDFAPVKGYKGTETVFGADPPPTGASPTPVRNLIRYQGRTEESTQPGDPTQPFYVLIGEDTVVYNFVGGAASFGTCYPADAAHNRYDMHITSCLSAVTAGLLTYIFLRLPAGFTTPTMRGLLPPDMCSYPHAATDNTPGSWGDGYTEGKTDGYQEGYEAGEEAGHDEGYQSGYTEGKADGYTEGETAGHTAGYNEGKEDGYQEGYAAGETAGHDEGYQEGYTAGYTAGKADGYQEGYTAGETAGHEAGYSEGYAAGEEAGHDAGYSEGYAAGETAGHEAGYQEGYTAGYAAGKSDGYQEGYEAGYQAGQQGETPQPPADGKTHIAVNVGPIDRTMELLLVVHGPAVVEGEVQILGTLDVDWGEGADSYQVISPGETKTLTLTHEYMQAGFYDVVITGTNVTIELGHGGSSNGLVGQSTGSNTAIPISVRSMAIGSGVTAIASYGLAHLRGLQSLYIPDGVTLDDYAMRMCYSLEAVRLPSDLVEIPIGCFRDCTSLRAISLPDSVTTINNYAFYGCSSLQSITIPAGVVDIGSSAFYGCAALQSFTIPTGVTELPSSCFRGCTSLHSLTLSPNTTIVRGYALYGASALESLEVPASVTSMADYSVYSAYGLRWMRMLPTTPPSTSQYTFSSIPPGLKFIVPDGSGEAYKAATRWKTYAARIFEENEVSW